MPTAVKGFQIADGSFFECEKQANYEETRLAIAGDAVNAVQVTAKNFEAFLEFIEKNAYLIREHCNNYIALQNNEETRELAQMTRGEIVG